MTSQEEQRAKWKDLYRLCRSSCETEITQGLVELSESLPAVAKSCVRKLRLFDEDRWVDETLPIAFKRISSKVQQCESADHFGGWCWTITYNSLIELLVKEGVIKKRPTDAPPSLSDTLKPAYWISPESFEEGSGDKATFSWEQIADGNENTEGTVISNILSGELELALTDALRHLPPRDAAVIMGKHYFGMSSKQLAEILGIEPGYVNVIAHRVRKILRQDENLRNILGQDF